MKIILSLIIGIFAFSIQATANELIGTWIQQNTGKCGYGNVFTFRKDKRYELKFSSSIVKGYEVKDNLLVTKDLSLEVNPPIEKLVYFLTDNRLIIQRVISESPLKLSERGEFTRLTPRSSENDNELVGVWKALSDDLPLTTYEFTNSGKKIFSLNSKYSSGVYVLLDGILRFGSADDKMYEFKYSVNDGELILSNKNGEQLYKKI
jgi:hypothetical protein